MTDREDIGGPCDDREASGRTRSVPGRPAALSLLALLLVAAAPDARAGARVIPPGQESIVRDMLAGDPLPGDCRLREASIEPDRIFARFACAAGDTTIELVDPERAAAAAARSAQFAVRAIGTPPEGFLAALEARIRAGETGFFWQTLDSPAAPGESALSSAVDRRAPAGGPPWMLLAAFALAGAGIAGSRPRLRDVAVAFGLGGGALLLRTVWGPWGPFHVNGQGPAWLAAAIGGSGSLDNYGPGYAEVFGPIARLWSDSPDTAIFLANAIFCAAIPALAWVVARLLRIDPRVALGAAVLLALDPGAVRMGATESYLPTIACLTLAATALLLGAVCLLAERRWWVAGALGLAAALLCAQVVRIHPVAWGPTALVPLIALAAPGATAWRRRLAVAGGAAIALGALAAAVSAGVVAETWGRMRAGTLMQPESPSAVVVLAVVAVIAAAIVATRRLDTLWLVVVASAYVLLLAATVHGFGQSAIAQHGYARLFVPLPLLALAAHVPRRWAAVGTAALAALLVGLGIWVIPARTTEHHEYRWLRGQLEKIPAGCYVAHLSRAGNRSLFLPVYPPRFPLSFDAGQSLDVRIVERGRCVVYVHGSICTSAEGRPACEEFHRPLDLEIVARTTLPAAPSFDSLPYDRDAVECWVARVRGPMANTGDRQ